MIRPLRRRHRRLVTALLVGLPPLVVAALVARPPTPAPRPAPRELAAGAAPAAPGAVWTEVEGAPVRARRVRVADGERLELELTGELARPDVLVYWSPSPAAAGVPEGSWLLGALGGGRTRSFALPADAAGSAGSLLLYSLAHEEAVGRAAVPSGGGG